MGINFYICEPERKGLPAPIIKDKTGTKQCDTNNIEVDQFRNAEIIK